ncbi:MAG: hypothetical protein Q8Q73_08940 [Stagnimonas sp.]|nr:hypothetical protein [Stagnimonas sp.]
MSKKRATHDWGMPAVVACMLLAACGGGGSDGGGGTTPPPVTLTGKLIDAAIGGVKFTSNPSGTTGITSSSGEFKYVAGDTVQFAVGSILLGTVSGQDVVTPKVIADATENLPAGVSAIDVAQNLAIFLQSFDADGNPDNGITIAAGVGTAAASLTLSFSQPTNEFVADTTLSQLASTTGSTIVTAEQANAHQTRSLAEQLAGTWLLKESNGSVTTATFFTDGTYVLGQMTKDPDCTHGVEWGRYELDANAGTIVARDSHLDTTGDCGLNNPGNSAQQQLPLDFELGGDGNTLTLSDDEGSYPLTRVPVGTGLAGSWLLDQPVAEGEPIVGPYVLTLLEDGTFLLADIGEPELNPGSDSQPGIEYGKWTTGSDNSFTITQIITDTDGPDAGFSTGTATRKLVNGKIVITDEDGSVSLTRLPLQDAVTAHDLVGTWVFPSSEVLVAFTFYADGTFLYGEDDDDPPSGLEAGTWSVDPSSSRVLFNVSFDNNGDGGLSNGVSSVRINASLADGTLTFDVDNDGEPFAFKKLPRASSGIVGAWRPTDNEVVSVIFLADGRFAWMENDTDPPNGYETGSYVFNTTAGTLTLNCGFDSNHDGGACTDEDGNGVDETTSGPIPASFNEAGQLVLNFGEDGTAVAARQ